MHILGSIGIKESNETEAWAMREMLSIIKDQLIAEGDSRIPVRWAARKCSRGRRLH